MTPALRNSCLLLLCLCLAPLLARAALAPETRDAYQKYIASLEPRLQAQNHSQPGFLWMDSDPARLLSVRRGNIATEKINSLEVPGGMIQHWIGGEFLPGATLAQVEQVDKDYAAYARIYAPDISNPKVLAHSGDAYVVSYRITKTKVLTAVMETVHAIQYEPLGPGRLAMQSRSESVRQVDDAGKLPPHARYPRQPVEPRAGKGSAECIPPGLGHQARTRGERFCPSRSKAEFLYQNMIVQKALGT